MQTAETKHPSSIEPYFVVWCDPSGTNTSATANKGQLQGETIVTSTWTVPSGITKVSDNTNAVTINGISYGASTVSTAFFSGGTDGQAYEIKNVITTATRTLAFTFTLPVSSQGD